MGTAHKETSFMGKIAAGATHELKNVLAVIGESAGLLEDLLALPDSRDFLYRERFMKAFKSIENQILRGSEILTHLNRFAHSADHQRAIVDLVEVLETLRVLSERFMRMKDVSFQVRKGTDAVSIETFPMRLHVLLFHVIDALAQSLPKGSSFQIRLEREGGEVGVCFQWPEGSSDADAIEKLEPTLERNDLTELAQSLQATLSCNSQQVVLRFNKDF